MFRLRLVRALGWLALMGALLYVLVSLYLPSSRRLILGVDQRSGKVRLVQNRVTFLPPHQFYRLEFEKRSGAAQRDGFIRILSAEGVPVTVSYRLRFVIAGDRIPDPATLVNDGWSAWVGRRVAEAVDGVTRKIPIEQLLAPTSQFNKERDPLRQTVAAHLARSGLKVTGFEIARIEADREALLRVKRAELRRSARGVAGRVVIFALDGADWELIGELSDDERIPNLKALARGGTTASVQTIQPTVSPMLWTSVATGLPPDRHGVIDFIDRARNLPVNAGSRRAPTLWEIAEPFGRHAMAVNWWTAWPPISRESVLYDDAGNVLPAGVSPPKLDPRAKSLEVPLTTVNYDQVRRFLTVRADEFDDAVKANDPKHPVNVFRRVLSKTWSDHRVAINLYAQEQPLLMMMQYSGTDIVNHLFGPYHPPYREGVSQENYRRYWAGVANYYAEIDRLIGEWMSILPADTTVIVMSAHGFRWGKNRPRSIPQGAALSDHRNPGMFIAYGNHVIPNRASRTMSLYDVAPTVLAILGLPQSAEMPGQVATWALRNVTPVASVRVVSYSEFVDLRPGQGPETRNLSQYQTALQAVGHLSDPNRAMQPMLDDEGEEIVPRQIPPEQWGSYAWYNNQGVELRKQNKLGDAVDAFDKAIELNPTRPIAHLNKAMVLFDRQHYTAADEEFLTAVRLGLPNAERWFVDFAALYRDNDMTSRAIALLYKGREVFPQSYLIAENLGSALAQADRYTEGLPELERALGLQPSSTLALNNIGIFYARKNDYARALDFWNRSLAINPQQPQIREAATAARSHL